ncbi:MAG: hypothetical protein KDE28_09535, partial [Anaerolineales bacterium]|nr:hypothetical protein [Anaerolineales bacterium]
AIGITNLGDEPLNWSASDSLAHHNVDLILSSGQIAGHGYASVNLVIDDLPDFGIGWHDLGDITVTTTTLSGDPAGSAQINLQLFIGNSTQIFLPMAPKP